MNIAKLIFILLLSLSGVNLHANSYVKDLLVFKNDTLLINQIPLNSNLEKLLQSSTINKKECSTLNCLDGYRIWELRNDSLFLREILNCCGDKLLNKDSVDLLDACYGQDELFAAWINKRIYNQFGQLIKTMFDYRIYEYDREFVIENGVLQEIVNHDNRKSKESIYSKNPELLSNYWLEEIDWDFIKQNNIEEKRIVVIRFEVDEEGRPINLKVMKGVNEACDAEILKAVKNIPEWDRYYMKGELLSIKWNLPIYLDGRYEKD